MSCFCAPKPEVRAPHLIFIMHAPLLIALVDCSCHCDQYQTIMVSAGQHRADREALLQMHSARLRSS